MKKLDDIPRKEIFNVPDGYFDSLPGKIQARIITEDPSEEVSFIFRYKLQYVLPVVALLAIGIYWYSTPASINDPETLLASVQTEQLVAYLGDSDITTEDILESVEFNAADLEDIESKMYDLNSDSTQMEDGLGDIDIDNI